MNFRTVILIFCFGLLYWACNRNKMKTDEQELSKRINSEEAELNYKAKLGKEQDMHLVVSTAKLTKGLRFEEDRSIDKIHRPILIDIEASRHQASINSMNLSDLFKEVHYIRLEQDPDSLLAKFGGRILFGDEHIYLSNHRGSITQYSETGVFIQYVCKSELHYDINKPMNSQIVLIEGATNSYFFNGKLYYKYVDQINNRKYYLAFDDSKETELALKFPFNIETMPQIRGKGEVVLDLNQGNTVCDATIPYYVSSNMIAFTTTRKIIEKQENLINLTNANNTDTICCFSDYDKVANFSSSVYTNVEDGISYYFHGILHIRQAFNDTIYQVIPPNRLMPRYILNFGEKGLQSAQEAVDPHFNLDDKLILQDFLETNRYLFITYSKNYGCPSTARNGTLKYSRLIYDKKLEKLMPIYTDEAPYMALGGMSWPSPPQMGIINDFNDLPSRWPYGATEEGDPFSNYNGSEFNKVLQDQVGSQLRDLSANDRIIVIYKD